MNPLAAEWAAKADGDLASAGRELRARKNPNYDAACFHAQQCVEKYLKAVLQGEGVAFTRTHDLGLLLDLCVSRHSEWEAFRPEMEMLTQYAVLFRYPGESATSNEAAEAVRAAKRLREILRLSLR